MKNGLTCIACSWKRRGESSHGYCTSTPGSRPPSISVPCTLKIECAAGNAHHAFRRFGCRLCWRDLDDVLRQRTAIVRERGKRFLRHRSHALHQRFDGSGLARRAWQESRHSRWLQLGKLRTTSSPRTLRLQFHAVIEVEVVHAGRERHVHLRPVDVVGGCGSRWSRRFHSPSGQRLA